MAWLRVVVGVSILSAIGCAKGDTGSAGSPGPTGSYAPPPRIDSVQPSAFSAGVTVTIAGSNLGPGPVEVLVDGAPASVLSASGIQVTITQAAPAGLAAPVDAQLVAVVNGASSNPVTVTLEPKGAVVRAPTAAASGTVSMAPRDDLGIELIQSDGRLVEVDPTGNLSLAPATLPLGVVRSAFEPGTGLFYATATELRYYHQSVDRILGFIPGTPGAQPRGITFDGANDQVVLLQLNATTASLVERSAMDGTWTTLNAGFAATDVESIWDQGGQLYIGDAGSGKILEIDDTAGTVTNASFTGATLVNAKSVVGDGTNLYVYSASGVQKISAAGTVTSWSTLTPGPLVVDEIGLSGTGTLLIRSGDMVWRQPTPTTFTSWVAPLPAGRAVGAISGNLYAASDVSCGSGSSTGGVLYGIGLDGSARRVMSGFCGREPLTFSYITGFFLTADHNTQAVESINPTTGLVTPLVAGAASARFVLTGPGGFLYVVNQDAGGTYVSKYGPTGLLLSPLYVTTNAAPVLSGAVAGSSLDLGFAGQVRGVRLSTGGTSAPIGGGGFQPQASALASTLGGTLLVTDSGDGSLWSIDPSGTPLRIATLTSDQSGFYEVGDGRFFTAGPSTLDLVMP